MIFCPIFKFQGLHQKIIQFSFEFNKVLPFTATTITNRFIVTFLMFSCQNLFRLKKISPALFYCYPIHIPFEFAFGAISLFLFCAFLDSFLEYCSPITITTSKITNKGLLSVQLVRPLKS